MTPSRQPPERATPAPSTATAVRLTHPERLLYPAAGISKGALADYFTEVGAWLMRDLAGRPVTVVRCPGGITQGCFFQKHLRSPLPEGLEALPVREESGRQQDYLVVSALPGVLGLLQNGAIELHTWGAHAAALEAPDRLVFDLDPDEALAFAEVVKAAQEVRTRLADLGLQSFVKTTGGKGLHVVAPLAPGHDWPGVHAFSRALARQMEQDAPDRYVTAMARAQRAGRIFIDYLRNTRGATAITPYAPRARPQATVATPVFWEELKDRALRPVQFTVQSVPARLQQLQADPWAAYDTLQQAIPQAALPGAEDDAGTRAHPAPPTHHR